jgi:dipeptidyl aminopeptidase/acylaminoacyl peptidase
MSRSSGGHVPCPQPAARAATPATAHVAAPATARVAAALAALVTVAASAGCRAVRETALETRSVPEYTVEQILDTTAYAGASFAADGKSILVSSDRSGIYNAWSVPVEGGEPAALTQSTTDAINVESYFPGDDRFLYSSDQGGNELSHLYVRERDGTVGDLTPGEKLKASFRGWSRDDRSFFVATNEREPRDFDLYELTTDGYKRTLLYRNEAGYELGPVSSDKRFVALRETRTETDTDIHLYDRQTGRDRVLTAHQGEMWNDPQEFSRDGRWLYYLSDEGSEFRYLVRMDLESGHREVIEKPDWDVEGAGFSRHGAYLWIAINADARTELRLYHAETMQPVTLPALPRAALTSLVFSPDEKRAALYVNGSRQPSDLYLLDLETGRGRALTHSLNPAIRPDDLVEGEVARFHSYDNVEIPGLLYKPHQASIDARAPALVWVHGGPGDQSRLTYNGLLQYLVNHGYVVFAINNRGSRGYGRTFYMMDDRKHGEADLGDCVASKKFLTATGFVDPPRIGIIGGSYGGYMVLAALAFRPDEFVAGVDLFGVSNWVRTLTSIPPYWESFRKALYKEMGDPRLDEAYLKRISPLFHTEAIRRPLLVLQGANDPRVLKVESDEIVEAVRAHGVPVEYLVFDDEGHGFRKKENRNRGYGAVLAFLDQHLKTAAGAPRTAPAAEAPASPAPGATAPGAGAPKPAPGP